MATAVKKPPEELIPPQWLAESDTGIYRDPPKKFFPLKTSKDVHAFVQRTHQDAELFDLDHQLSEAERFADRVLTDPKVSTRTTHEIVSYRKRSTTGFLRHLLLICGGLFSAPTRPG